MSRFRFRTCRWLRCAFYLAPIPFATIAGAQEAAPAAAGAPAVGLPASIELPEEYPFYGIRGNGKGDALFRAVAMQSQQGDDYVLALAQAADINLICVSSQPLPDVTTYPQWEVICHLAELGKDSGLSCWRAGARTVVFWPQPNREVVARDWIAWWQAQTARDEATQAVTDDEAAQALKQLEVRDTSGTRRQLREDYAALVRERLQRQVRGAVSKYLQEHGGTDFVPGRVVTVRDLPSEAREAVATLARITSRERFGRNIPLWYSTQREEFWKQARLTVNPIQARSVQQKRWLQLKGPDSTARAENEDAREAWFTVGHFDPRPYDPFSTKPVRISLAPRPEGGLRLQGQQLPLRQVLDEVQKQSGLAIEVPVERVKNLRLTLDVRGMEPLEFLQSLSRALLVKWQVDGKRATAQEVGDDASSRHLLQMGNLDMFTQMIKGKQDAIEENELGQAIRDEGNAAIMTPNGLPISGFSSEVQEGVRRETEEEIFGHLLNDARSILPVGIEQARLGIVASPSPPPRPLGAPRRQPIALTAMAVPPTINLLLPGEVGWKIASVEEAVADPAATSPAQPPGVLAGQDKVSALVTAYLAARQKDEQKRAKSTRDAEAFTAQAQARQAARQAGKR